jgi:hypothetical protein
MSEVDGLLDQMTVKLAGMLKDGGTKQVLGGAAAILGGVTTLDYLLKLQSHSRMEQMVRQEKDKLKKEQTMRSDSKLVKEAYNYQVPFQATPDNQVLDPQYGLVQKLYGQKTGHTNTFGGRKY